MSTKPPKSDLIQPPSSVGSVSTPRTRDKLVTPKQIYKKPSKPYNFKELSEKMEKLGKLGIDDFNSVAEMTAFLDFYNNNKRDIKEKIAQEEIHEISRFLADHVNKKYFFMDS